VERGKRELSIVTVSWGEQALVSEGAMGKMIDISLVFAARYKQMRVY